MPKRQRIAATDNWQQLELRFTSPEQRTYELIRPVVLFGHSPAERAQETGAAQRTLYRRVQRFAEQGMASLFDDPPSPARTLPMRLRQLIVELKAEYGGLRPNEIATICYARTGRRPSPHTVKRVLAEEPPLLLIKRRFPPFHDTPDPAVRRKAILRLHTEGWNAKSIAGYVGASRETVHQTLRRWITDGVHGLADKPHARRPGGRKVTLRAIHAVRRLQQNPGLGEWRVHAALRQEGIVLSPRTVGRILALNRSLYNLPQPTRGQRAPQAMPFQAQRRHQFWTVDIRYLDMHQLGGGNIYCISILENYSRAILASAVSRTQDLTAYLMVLYAAIRQHGAPDALVSDGGAVFKAKQALEVYAALGIVKEQIDQGQAWQSYIETQFNVQRRMADWHFTKAATWDELRAVHDQWVADFNFQQHWAHRRREDGRHSPAEVLGWVHGRVSTPEELHRTFYTTRFKRRLDQYGYVRFRHWRVYGAQGLPNQPAVVWLYGETLTVAFGDTPLTQYRVSYQPNLKHLRTVTEPRLFDHPYGSPQLSLWELGEDEWLKVQRLPVRPVHKRQAVKVVQERLFA